MAVLGSNVLNALSGLEAEHTEASLGVYKDGSEIADYARESVALLTEEGNMQGVTGSKFDPDGTVNRAQAAVMIYNLLGSE
ncbi:S-layer homology domain-containing protein [Paenibacillus nanensis]|uniref:S-layer homology domain-containing protein n=1 Tax=Paenibacillus nanensis TaxID=393251 RepID=A0A3A1UTJ1_9BACL|nr:S-layer homology domain-containing protein [Paenibacillus nanensis]RIX51574.1 S-layer homology domain-containing protein [Paenibacillus nanensis]